MEAKQLTWQIWSDKLHRWGLRNFTISFLEACGPLTVLAAQFFYLGQPFYPPTGSRGQIEALASMLEDTRETKKFVTFLRESALK